MMNASEIKEHMEIAGSDGQHLGTVDKVEGDRIKLTKNDSSDRQHHYLSVSKISGVEGGQLKASATKNDLQMG
ncbi:DUF2171 domain-containing protein [Roseomonas sp. CCTCC AB2023176]|uniref:DUF2171 domain-containing protein n=1 Tax=Roseomonas sp. CCTCC AB2023176 TaxID=3342640 RepID=UPI0035DFC4CE